MTKSSIEFDQTTFGSPNGYKGIADQLAAKNLELRAALKAKDANIAYLKEEIASLRKDAERYRWLRNETMLKVKPSAKVVWRVQPEMQQERWVDSSGKYQIDEAIDAAIIKEPK